MKRRKDKYQFTVRAERSPKTVTVKSNFRESAQSTVQVALPAGGGDGEEDGVQGGVTRIGALGRDKRETRTSFARGTEARNRPVRFHHVKVSSLQRLFDGWSAAGDVRRDRNRN